MYGAPQVLCVYTYYYKYMIILINISKYKYSYIYVYTGVHICIFMKVCMYGAPRVWFVCIHIIIHMRLYL